MFQKKNKNRKLVIDFSWTQSCWFAITVDGWSNSSLKGCYTITIHWVCVETPKSVFMLLDFFNVFPSQGFGKNVVKLCLVAWNNFALVLVCYRWFCFLCIFLQKYIDGVRDAILVVTKMLSFQRRHFFSSSFFTYIFG